MNQQLILNGIILENSYVIPSGNNLFVYVYANVSYGEVFNILYDPANVQTVIMEQNGDQTVYDGYSELFVCRKEDGGFISAGLRKPV